METLLSIQDLKTYFYTGDGPVKAIDGLSFDLIKGTVFGLVGESGCGKSVTALSIMRILPPAGKAVSGRIFFKGEDLLSKTEPEMRRIRGAEISMIFQEPIASLNPLFTIGYQIEEAILSHLKMGRREAKKRVVELLKAVGMPSPEIRAKDYPHQLSGGMCQRAMIAMAIACEPSLIIADEPTTALDVTIQAQILDLLRKIREESGTSMIMITHDLGIIAETADSVAVMYTGRIVESTDTKTIFRDPRHPYTRGLLDSLPRGRGEKLIAIPGMVPKPSELPEGCKFSTRCRYVIEECQRSEPVLREFSSGHWVRCIRAEEIAKL
ncbi:MAG: ABC transporter ATP-binding protein [Nitrospirota bacterium]